MEIILISAIRTLIDFLALFVGKERHNWVAS